MTDGIKEVLCWSKRKLEHCQSWYERGEEKYFVKMVVDLWVTIRGFSFKNAWIELYKKKKRENSTEVQRTQKNPLRTCIKETSTLLVPNGHVFLRGGNHIVSCKKHRYNNASKMHAYNYQMNHWISLYGAASSMNLWSLLPLQMALESNDVITVSRSVIEANVGGNILRNSQLSVLMRSVQTMRSQDWSLN